MCWPSLGVPPPNTELESIRDEAVAAPFGDIERDSRVDVDAKRDETEGLEVRYGKLDVDDAMDRVSAEILVLGSFKEEVFVALSDSNGTPLLRGVMNTKRRSSSQSRL